MSFCVHLSASNQTTFYNKSINSLFIINLMNDSIKKMKSLGGFLNPVDLKGFLLAHLNRIYCAKSHLHERLPELAKQINFSELQRAMIETWEDLSGQMARIEEIYVLLDEAPSFKYCDELIRFVENGFISTSQQQDEPKIRELSILFYLSIIESIEIASCELLQMATVKLANKQIKQLLEENFNASKAHRILFLQITAVYTE